MLRKLDMWGKPIVKRDDGHGSWNCNDYHCEFHPPYLYRSTATYGDMNKLAVEIIAAWLRGGRSESLRKLALAQIERYNNGRMFIEPKQREQLFTSLAGMALMPIRRQRLMCENNGLRIRGTW